MKQSLLSLFFFTMLFQVSNANAQNKNSDGDSLVKIRSVPPGECPTGLLHYINRDSLQSKAALFIFNNSLHPLGRLEFRDNEKLYRGLKTSIRMNRCILLYIDTGMHRFHTVYQVNGDSIRYHAGEVFIARLITRTTWPPLYPVRRKNKNGEMEEFGPVLFNYTSGAGAKEDLERIKKKEVILNE